MIFILLPRIDLSDIPKLVSDRALTGVTDRLEIGRFSEVIQSGETAFRAFLPTGTNVKEFYWRVYVLTHAKNGKWERGLSAAPAFQRLKAFIGNDDPNLTYTVRHANPAEPWLPVLGSPSNLPPPNLTQISLSGEITIPAKTDRVPRIWKLNTVTGSNSNATLPESTNLQGHPRLTAWAQKQRRETDSDAAFAKMLLGYFQSQGFSYSLSPPPLRGDKMDDFFLKQNKAIAGITPWLLPPLYVPQAFLQMSSSVIRVGLGMNLVIMFWFVNPTRMPGSRRKLTAQIGNAMTRQKSFP